MIYKTEIKPSKLTLQCTTKSKETIHTIFRHQKYSGNPNSEENQETRVLLSASGNQENDYNNVKPGNIIH
jgi:hypothetical protein